MNLSPAFGIAGSAVVLVGIGAVLASAFDITFRVGVTTAAWASLAAIVAFWVAIIYREEYAG